MAPSITAGMIVPAFTSYGDTGMRTEARRYSGGRSLGFVSTRRAPRASQPDAALRTARARARALRADGDQPGQEGDDQDGADDVDDPAIQSHNRTSGWPELQRTACAHLALSFFFLMTRRPPTPSFFPPTPLFR